MVQICMKGVLKVPGREAQWLQIIFCWLGHMTRMSLQMLEMQSGHLEVSGEV